MANGNIAAAAQLQGSAGRTALGLRQIEEQRRASNQRLTSQGLQSATKLIGQQISERGANQRQQAQIKSQRVVVTKQMAAAFAALSPDEDKQKVIKAFEGQEFQIEMLLGLTSALSRQKAFKGKFIKKNVGTGKDIREELVFVDEESGQALTLKNFSSEVTRTAAQESKERTQKQVRLRSVEGNVRDFVKRFSKKGAIPDENAIKLFFTGGRTSQTVARMKAILADAERTEKFLEEIDSLRTSLGRDPSPEEKEGRAMIEAIRESIPEEVRQTLDGEGGEGRKDFTSAKEVRAAFKAKKISKAEAKKIISERFSDQIK